MLQGVAVCCSVLLYLRARWRRCKVKRVCRRVMQCDAGCCRVSQGVAVCCNVLQGVAGCCRVLQGVAGSCKVLQSVAMSPYLSEEVHSQKICMDETGKFVHIQL